MDEGYVLTPETSPEAVETLRRKALRMDGPALDDASARAALSSQPALFYKSALPCARRRLTACFNARISMASRHVDGIRAGEAAPSPARVGQKRRLPLLRLEARLPVRRKRGPRARAAFGRGRTAAIEALESAPEERG